MRELIFYMLVFLLFVNVNDGSSQDCETRETGEFNSVFAMGKIRLEIIPYMKDSLVLTAEKASTEDVITEVSDGELNIRLKTSVASDARIKVELYYRNLEKISAASNAIILSPDTIRATSMTFEAKSGGKIELRLNLDSLIADVNQGATLSFFGEVDIQEVGVSSGAAYSAFGLKAGESVVKATTNGRAKITSTGSIEATAHTTGYISYKGNPAKEKIKESLGGEVVKLGD